MAEGRKERLLLCDCGGTMTLDAAPLGAEGPVCSQLCGAQIDIAQRALTEGAPVRVACAQEAATFEDLAAELGASERLACVDIRDRAGWSEEPAGAKMAALLAESRLTAPPVPAMAIESQGVCLVYGPAPIAVEAAERLNGPLSPTLMLTDADAFIPPRLRDIPVTIGRIRHASGRLGAFEVVADGFAELLPEGRGGPRFSEPRDGGRAACDVILDLSGGAPLFPAAEKRDGYLRADPRDPAAAMRAVFDAAQMVGEFEKPFYIRFEASLCAHSRARRPGCDRCLNVCPTGAITPDGDHVAIDPYICAGCGACAAVCPSGAAGYDAPPLSHLLTRMRTLIEAYRAAGGEVARLLVHDADHGAEMIALAARYGRGLPADVIPLAVAELGTLGHAAMLAALAMGFDAVLLLPGPKTDREALAGQLALAEALTEGAGRSGTVHLLDETDPDALCERLYGERASRLEIAPVLPLGEQRQITRLSAKALAGDERVIPLPEGAPYGSVEVNTEACTLCLACVSLCPSGALLDNPDQPQLRFQEDACLQCGVCVNACPESAITLAPRLNLADAALRATVKHEEEPFACIECGKLFGVKSTIERISEKLAGKHWMFTDSDNVKLIQMCDDCRVNAQFSSASNPFAMGARPPTRTTEDDLAERAAGRKPPKLS